MSRKAERQFRHINGEAVTLRQVELAGEFSQMLMAWARENEVTVIEMLGHMEVSKALLIETITKRREMEEQF